MSRVLWGVVVFVVGVVCPVAVIIGFGVQDPALSLLIGVPFGAVGGFILLEKVIDP